VPLESKCFLDDTKFFWFIDTHLGFHEQEIPMQLNQLLSYITSTLKEDIVLVGDFNFSRSTSVFKQLHEMFASHGFKDCGPDDRTSISFPGKKTKIDYIFLRAKNLKVAEIMSVECEKLSDHHALVCKLVYVP